MIWARLLIAGISSTLLSGTAIAGATEPADSLPLCETPDKICYYDPASVLQRDNGSIEVMALCVSDTTTKVQERYEINCRAHSFRQLEIVEMHNLNTNRCTTPSEPISLRPEKHLVAAALFRRLCP